MKKFLIAVLVMIMSLCVIFAFTACNKKEPTYCGIYYLGYENGEPQTKIEVTEKYVAINDVR